MNVSFVNKLDGTSSNTEANLYNSIFEEYERVIISSLITSFGLDFLIKDQHGGDVDTIHNVRQIGKDQQMKYKNQDNLNAYNNRGEYSTGEYHSDVRFASKKSKARQDYNENGTKIKDAYTDRDLDYTKASAVPKECRVELDHVVECKAIHDDRGRVLSGLNGVDLANSEDNLAWTNKSLNASMGSWARHVNDKWKKEHGCDAPLSEVDMKAYLKAHPEIDSDTRERMLAQYEKSRKAYDAKINQKYYTSSSFFKDTSKAAAKVGVKMGLRQALGLVFSEIWFAVRDEIRKGKDDDKSLFRSIGSGIKKGFENAKVRYKEIWSMFIEGSISGILASLTTTLCNIFFSTAKNVVRIIRQSWASLVEATKILLFNPDLLPFGERFRAATKIIATGASIVAGSMVSELIAKTPVGTIPIVGDIVQTFCGTLVSGIMSCSLLYILDRNPFINKIVNVLNSIPTIDDVIVYYRMLSQLLDEYCAKLMNIDLERFKEETEIYNKAMQILENATDNEQEMNLALKSIYKKLNLQSPFSDFSDFDSFMSEPNSKLKFC